MAGVKSIKQDDSDPQRKKSTSSAIAKKPSSAASAASTSSSAASKQDAPAKRNSKRKAEADANKDINVDSAVSVDGDDTPPPKQRKAAIGTAATAATPTTRKTNIKKTSKPAASSKKSTSAAKADKATKTKPAKPKSANMPARKRKADDDEEQAGAAGGPAPSTQAAAPAKRAKITPAAKVVKKGPVINHAPTQVLQCFVFGEGSGGELGLGTRNRDKDVTRPRLNPNLAPEKLGIVQIATGGMHTLALTRDNKIVTWGVNDQGALGRSTEWSGGLRDVDAEDSDSDEDSPDADSGMNPHEATPTAISSGAFPKDIVFTQLAAGDSCSFALTDDGQVWGWGTFRSDDGILGFTPTIHIQRTPMLMPTLHNIVKLSCGQNHAVALDSKGSVFAWGSGQQAQIGRKILERHRLAGLTPGEFGLPKKQIRYISTGQNHAFAIDNKDRVWAWGFNGFGQTGIASGAGEDAAFVSIPTQVKSLSGRSMKAVIGGGLHSMAIDADGNCLTWGRIDNDQLGVPIADMAAEDIIKSPETDKPRILTQPTRVKAITDPVATCSLGADHCIVVTTKGKAYSWGFSANYQTGQGTDDDVKTPTLIDNTAVREKHLVGAHAGGQFGILTAVAQPQSF